MFWLTNAQWSAIQAHLPQRLQADHLDIRSKISGIIHVGLSECLWADCPTDYGPHSTVYGCFRRWRHRQFWKDIIASFEQNGWSSEARALDATQVIHCRPPHKGMRIDRSWRDSFQKSRDPHNASSRNKRAVKLREIN
ncbi:transposase [Methylorubrum subtropicum]|uniref:transposase n=1 Tax=Methylorubrum subtropicum TaxID=3138812 RepID=UPI00399CAE73